MAMTLLTLFLIGTACDDKMDNPTVNPSAGKQVEVSLNIGFANKEDGISLSNSRSSNTAAGEKASTQKLAFDAQLISAVETRAGEAKPDQLYNLEIQQYNQSGARIGGTANAIAKQGIGSAFSLNLTEDPNCQLVIVAWGTSITKRLETGSFSNACDVMIDQSAIKDLDPTNPDDMKKMPYYIYLPSVKVSANTITNPDGTDVRLLLKRLATRVTLNWSYAYTGYKLKEVRLEGVPTNYRVIPLIDKKEMTHPSLLDQYTTIIVSEDAILANTYSCWIPASLRGTSNKATSAYYRNKENAPTGSVYATFIAQNKDIEKKKLNYRLYLGSNTSDNFDLNPNTNYNYQINFAHQGLPTNDRRVSIIDPIPASEGNDFLSPTANCFMVAPGGAFCFDPFAYRQNGTDIENSTLTQWATNESGIASVKLLWQTKENGDLGDPVMGVVNSATDHSNIVQIKRIDGGNGAPTQKGQARIYCRVAPNTTGGSGLIAAYNASNEIIWSWHVWVTNYKPDATGKNTVLTPVNKRKLKFAHNVSDQLPMMDRNLGAIAGYMQDDKPQSVLEMSKANGFHYQWGRKDPFPSSYSAVPITGDIGGLEKGIPINGLLNLYGPDGITYKTISSDTKASIRNVYKHPDAYFKSKTDPFVWCTEEKKDIAALWSTINNDDLGQKTVHDPCPAGWRVASFKNYYALFETTPTSLNDYSNNPNIANEASIVDDGGLYLYYEGLKSGKACYFRLTGYRRGDIFSFIGKRGLLWHREFYDYKNNYYNSILDMYYDGNENSYFGFKALFAIQDAHTTRCIQEKE